MAIPVARLVLREPTSWARCAYAITCRSFGCLGAAPSTVPWVCSWMRGATSEIFAAGLRRLGRAVSLGVETARGWLFRR